MSQEWHDELKSRGAFAAGLAQEIPTLLKDRTISAAQVAVLLDSLIRNIEHFDEFVEQMKACDVDQSLLNAAESIQRLYASIIEGVTNRLTFLQKRL